MLGNIPPEVRDTAPGIAGAMVALLFMRGRPVLQSAGIFLGGCVLAFFATGWVAATMDMQKADGLVGFLIGCFGMALMAKVFDTIEAIEPAALWRAVLGFIRKRLGLGEEKP